MIARKMQLHDAIKGLSTSFGYPKLIFFNFGAFGPESRPKAMTNLAYLYSKFQLLYLKETSAWLFFL